MKEVKGGVLSLADVEMLKKMISVALNPDLKESYSVDEKAKLRNLYHRLGRME